MVEVILRGSSREDDHDLLGMTSGFFTVKAESVATCRNTIVRPRCRRIGAQPQKLETKRKADATGRSPTSIARTPIGAIAG